MSPKILCSALGFIAIILWVQPSNAAFVDHNIYTTDTTTNLDWLDVSQTVLISKTSMLSLLAPGGQYEGWRYATSAEFNTLVSDYTGIVTTSLGFVNQEPNKIDGLISLLGSTSLPGGSAFRYTQGILADRFDFQFSYVAMVLDDDTRGTVSIDYSRAHENVYLDQIPIGHDFGSFLVRSTLGDVVSTVPEPTTISLLLSSLLWFGFRNRQAF